MLLDRVRLPDVGRAIKRHIVWKAVSGKHCVPMCFLTDMTMSCRMDDGDRKLERATQLAVLAYAQWPCNKWLVK